MLLDITVSASIMIVVVVFVRALAVQRLPKGLLVSLWGMILLRLLVPVTFSSPLSIYNLFSETQEYHSSSDEGTGLAAENIMISDGPNTVRNPGKAEGFADIRSFHPAVIIWGAGAVICLSIFLFLYNNLSES